MKYRFSVSYGHGPTPRGSVNFEVDLTGCDVTYLMDYLHKNGTDCDYGEIEFNNRRLFDKLNDAANEAVLEDLNKFRKESGEEDLDFDDVDWVNMSFDFDWPEELSSGQ